MSRVVFASELDGGRGQVTAFIPVALRLREQGHQTVFAVRNLPRDGSVLEQHAFAIVQAPIWLHASTGGRPPASYADLLLASGFGDAAGLTGLVRGWRDLFELLSPDLVLIDHAPAALLAARSFQLRRALFGAGFYSPPRTQPMPSFSTSAPSSSRRPGDSEAAVVDVANQVLGALGAPPLARLADLLDVDEDFVCTFPELDPYPDASRARRWGPLLDDDSEAPEPEWPRGRGSRVLVCLDPTYHDLRRALEELQKLPHRLLVNLPGVGHDLLSPYRTANVQFCLGLAPPEGAVRGCDLVVCHGHHGMVAAALLAGRPLLLLPLDAEQTTTAWRVVKYGVARAVNPGSKNASYKRLINEMLESGAFADAARGFASRYAGFAGHAVAEAVARRCEELLAGDLQRGWPSPGRS